jgi:uroporphyrinogen decarboxylase
MESNERISLTLRHAEPDRVPLDLGGTSVTSLSSVLLKQVLDYYALPDSFSSPDCIQGIGTPTQGLRRELGIDTFRIGPDRIPVRQIEKVINPERPWEYLSTDAEVQDQWSITWRHRGGDWYFSQAAVPLKGDSLQDALDSYHFPEVDGEHIIRYVKAGIEAVGQMYPVFDRDCAGMFEMSQRLRGMEALFMDLYSEPNAVEQLAESFLEYKMHYWDQVYEAVTQQTAAAAVRTESLGIPGKSGIPGVDFEITITEADDFGTEASLLIDPKLIRTIYLPRLERLIRHIKKRFPQAKISFHSCGAVRPLIPDFIEAGVDILNPVQYIAAGMDLKNLKKDFGKDIVFWGGCIDTTKILPGGTVTEVEDEVKRVLDIMAPGGGFVAAAVHNIQADVPLDNVVALFRTIREYGTY